MEIYAWVRQVSICCAEKYCNYFVYKHVFCASDCGPAGWRTVLKHNPSCAAPRCWLALLLLLNPQPCQAFVHNPLLFGCAALGSVSVTPAAELRIKRVFQVEECQSARIPLFPAASPASNPWPKTSPSLPPNYMQISPNKWVLSTWQPVSLGILKRPDG